MSTTKKSSKPRSVESTHLDPKTIQTTAEPSVTVDSESSVPNEAPVKTVTHLNENSEMTIVQPRVETLDPFETPVLVSPGVREQEKMLLGDLA